MSRSNTQTGYIQEQYWPDSQKAKAPNDVNEVLDLFFYPKFNDLPGYLLQYKQGVNHMCQATKWETLAQTDYRVIVKSELPCQTAKQPAQSLIAMISKTRDGIHVWIYTLMHQPTMDAKRQTQILEQLKSIEIKRCTDCHTVTADQR